MPDVWESMLVINWFKTIIGDGRVRVECSQTHSSERRTLPPA